MANQRPPRGGGPRRDSGRGPRPNGPGRRESPPTPRPAQGPRREEPEGGADRLQKILAHAGVGSRRACEDVILQGRVTVDGQIVRELGTRVDPRQAKIAVDGQRIHSERMVYFAVNKPKGYVSTNNDPSGRPRVVDILPEIPQRVYTVGRLDEMSTGLILLTNDGELANRLSHPKFGVEKLYRVVVAGVPDREVLTKLTDGVWLAEGKVRARRVRVVAKKGQATVLEMVLAEGKNREVRRMMAKFGHKVMTLTRVAVGPVTLKGLAPGQFRPLSFSEVDLLQKVAAGIPVPSPRVFDKSSKRTPTRPRPASDTRPGEGRLHRQAHGPGQGQGHGPGGHSSRPPQRRPGAPAQGGARRFSGSSNSSHGDSGESRRPGGSGPHHASRPQRPLGPPPSQRPAGPASSQRPLGPPPSQRSSGPASSQRPLGPPPSQRPGGPPSSQRSSGPPPQRSSGPRPSRDSSGPPPRRSSGPPSHRAPGPLPQRSSGPPSSQRRPGPQGGPRRPVRPESSSDEPPKRRIIGLALGTDRERPPRPQPRRAPVKPRFPRSALGPRPPKPSDEGHD